MYRDLLSGSDMDRFCDERNLNRPKPDKGRKPANNRRLIPGSFVAVAAHGADEPAW